MATFKKKELNEMVGGDFTSNGGDRNVTSNSEIETGPVDKPFNDKSEYQRGRSTTTDRTFNRYVQDIPWFAVYSFGGPRTGITINESKNINEKIYDLVSKSINYDITDKNNSPSLNKLMNWVKSGDLSDEQLDELMRIIKSKQSK